MKRNQSSEQVRRTGINTSLEFRGIPLRVRFLFVNCSVLLRPKGESRRMTRGGIRNKVSDFGSLISIEHDNYMRSKKCATSFPESLAE